MSHHRWDKRKAARAFELAAHAITVALLLAIILVVVGHV